MNLGKDSIMDEEKMTATIQWYVNRLAQTTQELAQAQVDLIDLQMKTNEMVPIPSPDTE